MTRNKIIIAALVSAFLLYLLAGAWVAGSRPKEVLQMEQAK